MLKELIDIYPTSIKKKIKEDLIHFLKISEKTLERIMYAKQGDKQDISGTNLIIISEYFKIQPIEFYNYTVQKSLVVHKESLHL